MITYYKQTYHKPCHSVLFFPCVTYMLHDMNRPPLKRQKMTGDEIANNTDRYLNILSDITRQRSVTQSVSSSASLSWLEGVLRDRAMTCVVNNPKSKFAMITYWWGRGRINKNFRLPCPQPGVFRPLYREGYTYEQVADMWTANMKLCACNYVIVEYPEFAQPGKYQEAINAKPLFISKALDVCAAKGLQGVAYIDTDMLVRKYPAIFDLPDVDMMARNWNTDPRSSKNYKGKPYAAFNPYRFETSGGIMYFGNSWTAREMLQQWHAWSAKPASQGKADDRILSVLIVVMGWLLRANIIQLPVEYLWLTKFYDHILCAKDSADEHIVIEHPACLTPEDVATENAPATVGNLGRQPTLYDVALNESYYGNKWNGGSFNEFVFFYNSSAVRTFRPYLKYCDSVNIRHSSEHLLDVVDLKLMYFPFNDNAKTHLDTIGSELKLNNSETLRYILSEGLNTNRGVAVVKGQNSNDIAHILMHFTRGKSVLYVPYGSSKRSAKSLAAKITPEIQLVAYVQNVDSIYKRHHPTFVIDRPMFMSNTSRVLRHALIMSASMGHTQKQMQNGQARDVGFNAVFNSSYIFSTRIRCEWLE